MSLEVVFKVFRCCSSGGIGNDMVAVLKDN